MSVGVSEDLLIGWECGDVTRVYSQPVRVVFEERDSLGVLPMILLRRILFPALKLFKSALIPRLMLLLWLLMLTLMLLSTCGLIRPSEPCFL